VIPNANGGLRVGLSVEPTVSYSSEETEKTLIDVFWVIPGGHLFYGGKNLNIEKSD